jgi:hypothetical protein
MKATAYRSELCWAFLIGKPALLCMNASFNPSHKEEGYETSIDDETGC